MAQTAKTEVDCDADHEVIWLAPVCEGHHRWWCQDDAGSAKCGCGGEHRSVKYVRADKVDEMRAEIERLRSLVDEQVQF